VVVVVAIYNVLAVICLSVFSGKKARLWDTCLNILKNPLLIASAIGLLFPLFGIRLPSAIDSAVNSLSDAASPIALFVLGAFIEFGSFERFKRELVFVCSFRLLIIPALFLTLGYLCGFRGLEFAALLGAFASSTAVTSFTMAQQMGGDADLAGAIVIMTSSLCPFTLLLWCMAAKTMGIL